MGAETAAIHQVVLNALKATGPLIQLEPEAFCAVLNKSAEPLVVVAESGVFATRYHYLTPYRGLTFYCKTKEQLTLPKGTEVISANRISIPEL